MNRDYFINHVLLHIDLADLNSKIPFAKNGHSINKMCPFVLKSRLAFICADTLDTILFLLCTFCTQSQTFFMIYQNFNHG